MSVIKDAIRKNRALVDTAYDFGRTNKSVAGDLIQSFSQTGGMGQLANMRDQSAQMQRYASNRGWVYSAVHSLCMEAAGQPVNVGRLKGSKKKTKGTPRRTKAHIRQRMTKWPETKAAEEEIEVVLDSELGKALEQPNPVQGRFQFVYSFVANLNFSGWAYIVGDVDKDGKPEFYSIPTTWAHPDHSKGPFSGLRVFDPKDPQAQRDQKPLTRDQFAFAYLPNPADPMAALAPAEGQARAITIDDSIQSSQSVFFANGIFPSVVITMGTDPHPDIPRGTRPRLTGGQRRQIHSAIRKVMGGIANYGNPAIIDGLVEKIERMSATSNEMGWEKSEKSVRTRILSAFGVHEFILGLAMPGSYAQAYVVRERFCERVNVFLDLLSNVMTQFYGRMTGENTEAESLDDLLAWWEKCVANDPQLEQKQWSEARKRNDVTQNEFRTHQLGLPPDEDRNEGVLETQSLAPVSSIAVQVNKGELRREQAIAILEGMGLGTDIAEEIAGEGKLEAEEGLEEATGTLNQAVEEIGQTTEEEAEKIADMIVERSRQRIGMKHLPGQHSQSTHGRGGGGGFEGKPANPNGKDTMEMFRRSDGTWTEERQALHDQMVGDAIGKATPVENSTAFMMGGGPASGKSSILDEVDIPDNHVLIDPDELKKQIPEYNSMKSAKDPKAASLAHEESSFVSKRIMKEASEGGYNTLADGTGDSSFEKLEAKVNVIRAGGRKIVANYVTVDTDTAVERNLARAERTGRLVPESYVRQVHSTISRIVPQAVEKGLFDEFRLFDTNSPGEARLVASAEGKNLTIHNQQLWDRFLAKGDE